VNDQQREAYKQKAGAKLDEMRAKLDEMKARAESASADAKLDLIAHIDEVSKLSEEARQRLSTMAEAGDDVWDEAKMRFEGAWDAVKEKAKSLGA